MYAPTFGEQSTITSSIPTITNGSGGSMIIHNNAYHSEIYITAADLVAQTYPGIGIALSTGVGWGTSIVDNSANWNTAYGWGNHSIVGYVTGTPWTAMGYLTSETSHTNVVVDGDFTSQGIMLRGASSGVYSILTDSSTNWNTAYGWGNHASGGYSPSASPTFTGTGSWDSPTFHIDSINHRVGVGTVAPDEKLHVVGNIKATGDVVAYSS